MMAVRNTGMSRAGGDERIDTGRYTLCMGPGSTWNTVQRQRFQRERDCFVRERRMR